MQTNSKDSSRGWGPGLTLDCTFPVTDESDLGQRKVVWADWGHSAGLSAVGTAGTCLRCHLEHLGPMFSSWAPGKTLPRALAVDGTSGWFWNVVTGGQRWLL